MNEIITKIILLVLKTIKQGIKRKIKAKEHNIIMFRAEYLLDNFHANGEISIAII